MLELNNVINELKLNNGCNIDASLNVKKIHDGYMVSINGHEKIIDINNINDINTQKEIYKAITEKKQAIKRLKELNHKSAFYIGLWLNDNKLYVDISINILSKYKAIAQGVKNLQYAIYDVKNGCDIELKKDVYIIYKYDVKRNDFIYIKECITPTDAIDYLKISKNHFYNIMQKTIDNFNISNLYLNKYAIIKEDAFIRDLQ